MAASVAPDRAISGARAERQAACAVQASESESSSQRAACAAQASESESSSSDPTGRSAVRTPSIERPVPLRLPRARAAAWIKSVADAAAAASVTPDRAISGARAEQRAACAAQASESESSSRVQLIESVADAAVAASVTPDKAISGARAEQGAACAAYVSLRLLRARAAAWIESVADAAAAASVASDRAISGAHTEQRAACAAQASEIESSSLDPTGRSAVCTASIERPVPLRLPRARAAAWIKSVADAAAAASVTPDRAISGARISGARAEQRAACAAQASRVRAAALFESVADAAAAASVTPDRAISGARAEQRAACVAQASESESSSFDRERCRRSCGGERHTRQGDQRCASRAASGLCRLCAA